MNRFEPPPLPGSQGQEPVDPYARPTSPYGHQSYSSAQPAPQAPWGLPAAYNHPRGTLVLVLGLLSVVMLPFLGPFAWLLGAGALKEIDAQARPAANRSVVVAGMVLGIIGTVFLVMGVLAFVVVLGVLGIGLSA